MGVFRRGNIYWIEFTIAGKRVREAAKTTRKTIAKEYEQKRRLELERAYAGLPTGDEGSKRLRSVSEVLKDYRKHYHLNHRTQSQLASRARLKHVERLIGRKLLPDLTERVILEYIETRIAEGVTGRTVNMELGELSRALGKTWRELWPKVRKLEERIDVGKALSPDEERALLEAARDSASPLTGTIIRLALLTAMRSGEIVSLTWGQVSFPKQIITVGRAKTQSGTGRQIPMNAALIDLLSAHAEWFTTTFGETRPEYYLFPFGRSRQLDPARHITTIKSAWNTVRQSAGVACRLHDLRHTALTKLAEAGVPESTMLALAGHMSRAMIERYSHIRMAAKREAVEALSLATSDGVPINTPTVAPSTTLQ